VKKVATGSTITGMVVIENTTGAEVTVVGCCSWFGDRLCGADGRLPPLPPGKYKARLYQSTPVVPDPKPVTVRVTR